MQARSRDNIFIIHSWSEPEIYDRARAMIRRRSLQVADYSVPIEKALMGSPEAITAGLKNRLTRAGSVVVLNSPGLHKRDYSAFEMETSVELDKRIVVVQPPGQFDAPLPAVLEDHVYRVAPWRGDVVERAIKGQYRQSERRVFDLAETQDRRHLAYAVAGVVGCVSFGLLVRDLIETHQLQRCLKEAGFAPVPQPPILGPEVLLFAAGFGLLGLTLANGDARAGLALAAAGAGAGLAWRAHRRRQAVVAGTGAARRVHIWTEPENEQAAQYFWA